MHALRTAHSLIRLVLAWFAVCLGLASVSPLVSPHRYEILCSGTGMAKLLVKSQDGNTTEASTSAMDCPLCAPGGAPPVLSYAPSVVPAHPLAYATWPIQAARIAALTAAPLPARGPPAIS